MQADNWSDYAADLFKILIPNARSVFKVDFFEENRFLGKLKVHGSSDNVILANEFICEGPHVLAEENYKKCLY